MLLKWHFEDFANDSTSCKNVYAGVKCWRFKEKLFNVMCFYFKCTKFPDIGKKNLKTPKCKELFPSNDTSFTSCNDSRYFHICGLSVLFNSGCYFSPPSPRKSSLTYLIMLCQLSSLYKNKEERVWVLLKQLVQMWEEAAFQKSGRSESHTVTVYHHIVYLCSSAVTVPLLGEDWST